MPVWHYPRATLIGHPDGDTVELDIDVGGRMHWHLIGRIDGMDTPECKGETLAMGLIASAQLESLLAGRTLEVTVLKPDKYAPRWDIRIWHEGQAKPHVAEVMITTGYALPYSGKGPRPIWDPKAPYPLQKGPQ